VPVTANVSAPYAPPSAVLDLIMRHRTRGLPAPVSAEVLSRSGIPESLISRTLQALKTLDLLSDDDKPTATLEGLRLASETEFRDRLAEWLNAAYADILNFVDPAVADETALRDAFRAYSPIGQQNRMVTLFSGLYAAAGIGPEKSANARTHRKGGKLPANTNGANSIPKRQPAALVVSVAAEQPSVHPHHHKSNAIEFERELLSKFPPFDPTWPDEIKAQWFSGFQQFIAMTKGPSQ
jgi:hypothetical protein